MTIRKYVVYQLLMDGVDINVICQAVEMAKTSMAISHLLHVYEIEQNKEHRQTLAEQIQAYVADIEEENSK